MSKRQVVQPSREAPDHVVLATGSSWRKDGIGAMGETPAQIADDAPIATPDALGDLAGPIVIYDDDHYAVASALAEKLKTAGHDVTYVTPASVVSSWTAMTDEQGFIQARLMALGVDLLLSHGLTGATRNEARFARHKIFLRAQYVPCYNEANMAARY